MYEQALSKMLTMYEGALVLNYPQIAAGCASLGEFPVKVLRDACGGFGVCPIGTSKAACVEAVKAKIERRKSTHVRCSF